MNKETGNVASLVALIGFALTWFVTFVFCYSFIFVPPEVVGDWEVPASRIAYLGGIAVIQIALSLASTGLLRRRFRIPLSGAVSLLLVAVCFWFHLVRGTGADIVTFMGGMILAGIWQGTMHVLWAETLLYFDSRTSFAILHGSVALGALFFIIAVLSAGDYSPILTVVATVAIFALYVAFEHLKLEIELSTRPISRKLAKGMRKSNAALVMYGSVFGVGIYSCMTTDVVSRATSYASVGAALFLAAAILLGIYLATGKRFKIDETVTAFSPVLAIVLLLLMYAQGTVEWALYLVLIFTLESIDITAFYFHLQTTRELALSPFMSIARGRAFAQSGMFLAALADFIFVNVAGSENAFLIPLVLVAFLFVMMSRLSKADFLPTRLADHPLPPEEDEDASEPEATEAEGGEGGAGDETAPEAPEPAAAPPVVPPGTPERHIDLVKRIAEDYDLSPREVDVLRLLMTGHNTESIADRLCISQNTVKSHRYHIYRKLGVNSKQEVINIRDQYFARYKGL